MEYTYLLYQIHVAYTDFNVTIEGYTGRYNTSTSEYIVDNLDEVYISYCAQTSETIRYLYEKRPKENRVLCDCTP